MRDVTSEIEQNDIRRRLEDAAKSYLSVDAGSKPAKERLAFATHYTRLAEMVSRHWPDQTETAIKSTDDDHSIDYAIKQGVYIPGNEVEINPRRPFVPWRHLFDDPDCGVLLILGQSNAGNHGFTRRASEHECYCLDFLRMRCFLADDPLPGASGNAGSVWSRLGDMLIENQVFRRVLFVPLAVGGTFISDWVPGGAMHKRTSLALSRIRREINMHFAPVSAVLWQQGEAEANHTQLSTQAYKMHFHDIVGDLRANGVFAPIFVARSTICEGGAHPYKNHNAIREAQSDLPDPHCGVVAGPDTDVIGADERSDGCHFSTAGLDHCAALWLDVLTKWRDFLKKI